MTRLKHIRQQKGLTQQITSNLLDISLRQYQFIEAGKRKPSYEVLCKLEEIFGLSHRELLAQNDGTGEPKCHQA
ncbi:hypothetical protein GCM10007416_05260 [Kroppenstedtia guangzhouensis]|uniref:HTH cro/C1-type domain-containing protein n=1 Tax=Kroppenstedtia guangzhouensis TaxID=1274356 RepID=A0ABQ1G137_9BACL|nr:helix-turn-helix transcriptional regulator [Kroppenstedtia guangzhouensis]GGA35377.1 hypothetical protein GCM10007416_05260 [Kroppenstedtia guangzhouensis]